MQRRFGRRVSVRLLLGSIIVSMGTMLFYLGVQPVADAVLRDNAARRIVALSAASRALFDALQNLRNERGNLLPALLADTPITPAQQQGVRLYRDGVERGYDQALASIAHLELPGLAGSLQKLQQAHRDLSDLRPKADAAALAEKPGRDPAVATAWADIGEKLLDALSNTTDLVDAAIRNHDAVIDGLLSIKRNAWVARLASGVQVFSASSAMASRKPWDLEQTTVVLEARGREDAAWRAITELASQPGAPSRLQSAFARARDTYFGKDRALRMMVHQALSTGHLPDITMDAWIAQLRPSQAAINGLAEAALAEMNTSAEQNAALARRTLIETGAAMVLALVLVVSGLIIVQKRVCGPVIVLAQVMRRLADQDFTAEVPGVERGDEIGAIANSVLIFKRNGILMRELESREAEQRRKAEEQRARAQAEQEQAAALQAKVVNALGNGLAQLAQGNLACEIKAAFAPNYERLRIDFNAAVADLQAAMRDVLERSQTIGNSTTEIADASSDLAQRTERQAASLQQTAAALNQIIAAVQQTASRSGQACGIAAAARAHTQNSAKVVTDAVAAMGQIDGSAHKIGQIISVIDEIALQTNMLALNAAVEAARAGETGRGFAVIAGEVRALAQRAAAAAKDIKGLITTSMQLVAHGVGLVQETGDALRQISDEVEHVHTAIGGIASSAAQQATGLNEVNKAVGEIDKVTQANASMVEQNTAAAHSLSRETDALNQAMARFKIGLPLAA